MLMPNDIQIWFLIGPLKYYIMLMRDINKIWNSYGDGLDTLLRRFVWRNKPLTRGKDCVWKKKCELRILTANGLRTFHLKTH